MVILVSVAVNQDVSLDLGEIEDDPFIEEEMALYTYDDFEVAIGDGHMHTNYSSGTTTVSDMVTVAKQRGLNWIAITDRNTITSAPECRNESTIDFICVVGEEAATTDGHVLAWGIEEFVVPWFGPTYTMGDIFESIRRQGGLATVAHPYGPGAGEAYNYWGTYDGFDAISIYHGYAGFNDFALTTDMDGLALAKWEEYLNNGARKTAVGNSDSHNSSNTPDGGDLVTRRGAVGYPKNILYVRELSVRGILEAVRNGRLYVTDGPLLNLTISERILGETIHASAPEDLYINVTGVATASSELNIIRNGTQIFTQSLSPGEFSYSYIYPENGDSWFRAEIRKPTIFNGEVNVAFSNPIYFDLMPYEQPPEPPANLTAELSGNDVFLTWDPSPSVDVEKYSVFRSDTYDGFDFNYPFAQTNATNWSDMDAGIGDNKSYFYIVRAVDGTLLNDSNMNRAAKFVLELQKGIHLVSSPVEPVNSTLGSVLQTLDYESVWLYNESYPGDHWKSRVPEKSQNELTNQSNIDRTMAFWVRMSERGNLTFAGRVPTTTNIPLKTGWNLVGYPSFANETVQQALSGVVYERIEGYFDAPPQNLKLLANSDPLIACQGYWIKVASDQTWSVTNP
jgi:hypothetical protein